MTPEHDTSLLLAFITVCKETWMKEKMGKSLNQQNILSRFKHYSDLGLNVNSISLISLA